MDKLMTTRKEQELRNAVEKLLAWGVTDSDTASDIIRNISRRAQADQRIIQKFNAEKPAGRKLPTAGTPAARPARPGGTEKNATMIEHYHIQQYRRNADGSGIVTKLPTPYKSRTTAHRHRKKLMEETIGSYNNGRRYEFAVRLCVERHCAPNWTK